MKRPTAVRALCSLLGAGALTAALTVPSGAAVDHSLPRGNVGAYKQIYAENFNGASVPIGAFSDCDHHADTPRAYCAGLKPFGHYYRDLWAYPSGWEDTAKSGADGNGGVPYGGTYQPQEAVSVGKGYDGTGTMKIRMSRPADAGTDGDNSVAAVVPRKCMNLTNGRYSARIKVTHADRGFKSAWLRYEGERAEVDYPEVDDYTGSDVAAFVHPQGYSAQTHARMTTAHTYTWERAGNRVTFYLDGKKIRTGPVSLTRSSWIWQNESRIERDHSRSDGGYAQPGAKAVLEVTWATCYTYAP